MRRELEAYADSGVYPFHMPGHKRRFADSGLPYPLDLTEIDGFDNLHHPEGLIREVEERAARLYRAQRAFLLVNGATGGIFAAMKAVTQRGDRVIIARNCHASVHRAAELLELQPQYLLPDPPIGERIFDCCGSVNPFVLDMTLQREKDVRLVVITSPTYEGICSDVGMIAEICRCHGVRLLVDEAHGAHFPFHDAFPASAISCGADLSVVSLHKTLPSLTQTALLLTNRPEDCDSLQAALSFFQTSSPSYVLMSSIDTCLRYAESHAEAFDAYVKRLRDFEAETARLRHLRLLFRDTEEMPGNVAGFDCSKLVISTFSANLSGIELANILRKKYKIETEMAAPHYIIAMTSVCDTAEGFARLRDALTEIDSRCTAAEKPQALTIPTEEPVRGRYAYEVERAIAAPLENAVGAVSAEDVFAYPPGIPLLVKGEVLTENLLSLIKRLQACGVNIMHGGNSAPDSILIADCN